MSAENLDTSKINVQGWRKIDTREVYLVEK